MKNGVRGLRAGMALIGLLGSFVVSMDSHADPAPAAGGSGVELKTVKYRDLVEAVRAQKGKVVAVDVWATWCPPCMKHFPHLVELQQKYRDQGLVCMSVSLDLSAYPQDGKARTEKFLIEKKATFPNFLLDEPENVWQTNWKTGGPPIWFVFDRQGRRVGKFTSDNPDNPIDYDAIDKLLVQLLQAKP